MTDLMDDAPNMTLMIMTITISNHEQEKRSAQFFKLLVEKPMLDVCRPHGSTCR